MWGYVLGIVLGSIILALLGLVLIAYLAKSLAHHRNIKLIGLKAEVRINRDIKTWAWQTNNLFLARSLFKSSLNRTFEVDAILITAQALFVIEIKSVRGNIEGDAQKSYWNKKVGAREFKIANPIFENEKNLDHIIKMLNVEVPIVSLIIFSNRTDYLAVTNVPSHALTFKHNQLFENLDDLEKNLSATLSKYEMRMLYGKLKSFRTSKWKNFSLQRYLKWRTKK